MNDDELMISADEMRGHIAYLQPGRAIYAADLGNALHFGGGWLMLDPDQARRVADSLHWWADRHGEPEPEQAADDAPTRVYIAGPMSGLPAYNYPSFRLAAEQLRAAGFEPLNPVDCGDGDEHDWQWYMRRTLAMLLTADRVALLPGWVNSRGAKVERQLAGDLRIPVTPIDLLLDLDAVRP